jgi:hypothetical protein
LTTYTIHAPNFTAALVVSSDIVLQAAPILDWAVGKTFESVRDTCAKRGWIVEPRIENLRPRWLELKNKVYELKWNGNVVSRISLHEDGEVRDLTWNELPEELRKVL